MGILLPVILNFDIFVVWIDTIKIVVAGHFKHSNSSHCIAIELDEPMYRCLHDIVEACVDDKEFGNKDDSDKSGNLDESENFDVWLWGLRIWKIYVCHVARSNLSMPRPTPTQFSGPVPRVLVFCCGRAVMGAAHLSTTWLQMGRDLTPRCGCS
ncbi:hypothetical protein CRG98_023246 [Punica granatum]|uniref:Uncharacterized protein n=1 Tax=Punica granatum TaxID=22663 RepID=A0A2I0JJA8_PUNGR|nr:hypothetical protein CRG98_023246 [Punica granatum]